MKKLIFSIMAVLAMTGKTYGQNALNVADFTIPQNGEGTLTVSFQFDTDGSYTAYQFNLELPDDLVFKMKEGTDVAVLKGSCHDESHTVAANLDEGLVKVAGLSLNSTPLAGTSGVLLTFTVCPATENIAVGTTFTGTIKDIIIVPVYGTKQKLESSTFTVTIGEPIEPTLLDEESTEVPKASDGVVDIKVKRTLVGGVWNTLCLPFSMTENQLKSAFGDDVQLAAFNKYEAAYDDNDNVTGINVSFDTVSPTEGFDANYPYLIKTSSNITEFTASSVIEPDEEAAVAEYDNGKSGRNRKVLGSFIGTYHAGTVVPANALFLNNNKFWYSTGKTQMKAFRGYFVFEEILSNVDNASAGIMLNIDGETITSIRNMERPLNGNAQYYDLQGRRVINPTKGLYIVNGKKVIRD